MASAGVVAVTGVELAVEEVMLRSAGMAGGGSPGVPLSAVLGGSELPVLPVNKYRKFCFTHNV